ncbi:nuclease-related domain-containing protein [Microbacterium sp. NPDC078428]|uniref:nuclease-related domain-containing protein n=1 Tax=Microbacterium sp. NPDC078428 TaxID=3364190 RepID=UPI0037C9A572
MSEPLPAGKRMRLRYSGVCQLCGTPLPAGQHGIYERETKTVRCVVCPVPAVDSAPERERETEPEVEIAPDVDIDTDVAGGSARREHERRKSAREQRIRANHPKLGGLILALSDDPQSTRAWERGAIGEELLAERLKDLSADMRVLHDRRVPGSRANIDHIVVSPAGVWVIDAKRYKGKRPELRVEGGILRPRVESLRVGGRDQTKLVDGVVSQVERVAGAVADPDVVVRGVLCFLEADWPLFGGDFTVRDIEVVWPRLLTKRISAATPAAIDVDAVYGRLVAVFPRNS